MQDFNKVKENWYMLQEYLIWYRPYDCKGATIEKLDQLISQVKGGTSMISIAEGLLLEGKEQGLEQGTVKGQELVALNMLRKGFPVDVISQVTCITEERILQLKKDDKSPSN